MAPENLQEANQLVLSKIGGEGEFLILGFLPLSEPEEEAVLRLVKEQLSPPHDWGGLERLWQTAPGALTYALSVAPSRSLTSGGNFWPALESDLNLEVVVGQRSEFALRFRRVCRRLGLLDGTIHDIAWIHAAPFIYQAGILHYWKDALAHGLRTTLKHYPAPDLEDPTAVAIFADRLQERIHNQPILKRLLSQDVGRLLVHRLVVAYSQQDWSVLPPHLQQPIREAFTDAGRGEVLRSPSLAFDASSRQMQIVLPAVPLLLAGVHTHWRIEGRNIAARRETRIPLDDLAGRTWKIELRDLEGGFETQTFIVEAALGESVPFRVFRTDTGREARIRLTAEVELTAGAYWVVFAKDIRTNDEDFVQEHDTFRAIEVELRPGDDPLVLTNDASSWVLRPALLSGIYVDRDLAAFALLENDDLLHYGDSLGLVAYFPAKSFDEASAHLTVHRADGSPLSIESIELPVARGDVYVFQENLHASIARALDLLDPGIHRLHITIAHNAGRADYSMWYWKGLRSISLQLGFKCNPLPKNLNPAACRGLVPNEQGFSFQKNFHAPFVSLVLTQPAQTLELKRAGIRVVLAEPGEPWEEEPETGKPIVVDHCDRRILRFQSGGFQSWEILCLDRSLIRLDRKKTNAVVSLAGIATEIGGSGLIRAKAQDGTEIPLVELARPLTASAPQHHLLHAHNAETWKFKVSVKSGFEIGVSITDLTRDPLQKIGTIETIAAWHEGGIVGNEIRFGAATIVVSGRFDETTGDEESRLVRVKSTHSIAALDNGLWAIDFFHRESVDGNWTPLESVEKHGYSVLRLFAWGDLLPDEKAGWWPRLRRAGRPDEAGNTDAALATALEAMSESALDIALNASRRLLGWKYPSAVWRVNAHRLQDIPVYLGRHRFSFEDGSAPIWWAHGSAELSDYASQSTNPVVRQFLFASKPRSLCTPRFWLGHAIPDDLGSSPIQRCFSVPSNIRNAGSLRAWVLSAHAKDELYRDVIYCFSNFVQVSSGTASEFSDFQLNAFLEGGTAGVPGLYHEAVKLNESASRLDVSTLLGPDHLLHCIRKLNRRCRPIEQVAQGEELQSLSSIAQGLEQMSQQLDRVGPEIGRKLGWVGTANHWWVPPLLESPIAQKVAGLVWVVAAICRLVANGRLTPREFDSYLQRLLCVQDGSTRTLQNRLCILLSIGPELSAFYIALFELTFPPPPDVRTN